VKFLVDANLPPVLTPGIRSAGHECEHVAMLLGADANDLEIAALANELNATLMSKDLDFVDLAQRHVLRVPMVHIRLGNMSARATCSIIWARLPQIVAAIGGGHRIIEVR
jgi:predicted nuclease of predicted toxin-antitoxin system